MLWRRRQVGDETFSSAAQISSQRHSPPPSPAISYLTSRSLRCPSAVPQLSLIQSTATHPQQSVSTPGSRTAPPSSCLQLIKSWCLNTSTHHLHQLQIQPCLQLMQPQQLLAAADLYAQPFSLPRYPVSAEWVTTHLQLIQAQSIDWKRFRHESTHPSQAVRKF